LTGPAGPQGLAGADGEDGAVGPQGPVGPIGLTGPAGPQGPQGLAGTNGEDGAAGPQGPPGADGAPGAKGDKGDKGDPGPAGSALQLVTPATPGSSPNSGGTSTPTGTAFLEDCAANSMLTGLNVRYTGTTTATIVQLQGICQPITGFKVSPLVGLEPSLGSIEYLPEADQFVGESSGTVSNGSSTCKPGYVVTALRGRVKTTGGLEQIGVTCTRLFSGVASLTGTGVVDNTPALVGTAGGLNIGTLNCVIGTAPAPTVQGFATGFSGHYDSNGMRMQLRCH
jgi:hypothetical protein